MARYFNILLIIISFLRADFPELDSTWYQIPNSDLRSVSAGVPSGHDCDDEMITKAWSSGCYDENNSFYFIWGGGHNDYCGNEVYKFDISTFTWSQFTTQYANAHQSGSCIETLQSGTVPNQRHTYDGIEFITSAGKFWANGGSLSCGAGNGSTYTWTLDPVTAAWVNKSPSGYGTHYELGKVAAYNANDNKVYMEDHDYFCVYNYSANSWTTLCDAYGETSLGEYTACIDTSRNWFIVIGGGELYYYDLDDPTPEGIDITATGQTSIEGIQSPGIDYDPVRDRITAYAGGQYVYFLNLDTEVWTRDNYANYPTGTGLPYDLKVYGHWRYMGDRDAFIFYGDIDDDVYLFYPENRMVVDSCVGLLAHDGPNTPEQLSLYLPIIEDTLSAVSASVKYRVTTGGEWLNAHPFHRIRPEYSESGTEDDAFAGVITGLVSNISYTVEVTVVVGNGTNIRTLVDTTRALPADAGTPTDTIDAGSNTSQIETVLNGLSAGDVCMFEDGTYTINDMNFACNGTSSNPIYIRGENRDGVILHDSNDEVVRIDNASNLVIENLTIKGSESNGGVDSPSEGIRFTGTWSQDNITIRNVTLTGIDKGIISDNYLEGNLVYNCTLLGNNIWIQAQLEANTTWNDDGIRLPGYGNCAWQNTLSGFGDSFAVNNVVEDHGIHYYRNEVLFTCDDAFEADYGWRNMTFYDNRIENSMTFISLDPLNGGPLFVFRNIAINQGRSPFKFNNTNTGQFIYNNTIINTNKYDVHAGYGWIQFNNGEQQAWGYRNNILIYYGTGNVTFQTTDEGNDEIDHTNNAWYPDEEFNWSNSGGDFDNLADAKANITATTPLFSNQTKRHTNDVVSESNPFIDSVALGANYLTKITTLYRPTLDAGSDCKAAGAVIYGITDGYSGVAPDIGAIIAGRDTVAYGDQSGEEEEETPSNNGKMTAGGNGKLIAGGQGKLQ